MSFSGIEMSPQKLSSLETPIYEPQFQAPLFSLANRAPPLDSSYYQPDEVAVPLSNDAATAPYFDELQMRTQTSEYQAATNHVAILIGESALASNLPFIPEKTIILLDRSPHMCMFMARYYESLCNAKDTESWQDKLQEQGPDIIERLADEQIEAWNAEGYAHPFTSPRAFATAQTQARHKAIIPWCADITSSADMNYLGQTLHDIDAIVTMMNLSNVLPYIEKFYGNTEALANLSLLPVTAQAPILASYLDNQPRYLSRTGQYNEQLGPFFGLDNLGICLQQESGYWQGHMLPPDKRANQTGGTLSRAAERLLCSFGLEPPK